MNGLIENVLDHYYRVVCKKSRFVSLHRIFNLSKRYYTIYNYMVLYEYEQSFFSKNVLFKKKNKVNYTAVTFSKINIECTAFLSIPQLIVSSSISLLVLQCIYIII